MANNTEIQNMSSKSLLIALAISLKLSERNSSSTGQVQIENLKLANKKETWWM